jgi:hypothetical protein
MKRVAVVVLLLALSGCGDGAKEYDTPRDLADALGCADTYEQRGGFVAPADVGICQFEGKQVSLVVGDTAEQRDATLKLARDLAAGFGGEQIGVVQGGRWAVFTEGPAPEQAVRDRLK